MRTKLVAISALLFLASGSLYAATLDPQMIQGIHTQLVAKFVEECKKQINGATDAVCNCLGDKSQANLDDTELAKCSADQSGMQCIASAVSAATTRAMSKENIAMCTTPAAAVPTPTTPAITPSTAPVAAPSTTTTTTTTTPNTQ